MTKSLEDSPEFAILKTMNTGYVGCAPSPFDPSFAGFGAGAPMYMPAYGGLSIVGADAPAAQPSTWDKVKEFGDKPSLGVPNKWWALGGLVVAGTWYAYSQGYLGRR